MRGQPHAPRLLFSCASAGADWGCVPVLPCLQASLEADAASAKSCFITKLLQQYVRSDAQEAFGPEDATGNPMLSLAELDKRLKRAIVREKGLDSICASMMWIIMVSGHLPSYAALWHPDTHTHSKGTITCGHLLCLLRTARN